MTDETNQDTDSTASPTAETDRESRWLPVGRRRLLGGVGGVLATGLAGCSFDELSTREFDARPYGLDADGMRILGFEGYEQDELEETRSASAGGFEGEVTLRSHALTYGRDATVPDETSFAATTGNSWSAGVLSTPAATVAGQRLNPLATQPLSELLVGERSGEFLSLVGLGTDAEWACEPERLETTEAELVDGTTEFELHVGVAETASGPVTTAVYAARRLVDTEEGETAVLAGFVDRRRLAADQTVADCRDDAGEFLSGDGDGGSLEGVLGTLLDLQEALAGVDLTTVVLGPNPRNLADFSIEDARLVQLSEDTDLTSGSGGPISDPAMANEVEAAVVFDISGTNLDNLHNQGIKAEITVRGPRPGYPSQTNSTTRSFRIPKSDVRDIADGAAPAAKFHQLARDGNSDTDPPVFDQNYDSVDLKLSPGNSVVSRDSTSWSVNGQYAPVLLVAFIHVKDPDNGHLDWGDTNGEAAYYQRSVNSSFEYLRRVFPARDVAGYRHDIAMEGNVRETTNNAVGVDAWDARKVMGSIVNQQRFPSLGTLYTEGLSRTRAQNYFSTFGPDVTVMILPKGTGGGNDDYYTAHGLGGKGGMYQGTKWAVGSLEATDRNANDRGHAATTAQEVGHYFAKLPFDDGSSDPFARNNSDEAHAHDDLESVGYALDDGTFTLVNDVSVSDGSFDPGPVQTDSSGTPVAPTHTSYMSYTGGSRWADNRITSYLVQGNTNPNYQPGLSPRFAGAAGDGHEESRKAEVQPVFEAHGGVRDGELVLERSAVFDGNPVDVPDIDTEQRLEDNDARPVEVALLGPTDEVVRTTVVPDRRRTTHGDRTVSGVALSIPFDETGLWVRTDYGGQRSRLNAVVHPLRDAVRRVPERGVVGDGSDDRLFGLLEEVDALMRDREYGRAASRLGEEFTAAVREEVMEYEALANEPRQERLLALTERQVAHLAGAVDA